MGGGSRAFALLKLELPNIALYATIFTVTFVLVADWKPFSRADEPSRLTIVYKNQHSPSIGELEAHKAASSRAVGDEQLRFRTQGQWI